MDYLSKLTENEAQYICNLIPVATIKDYFRKNPEPFNKIFPGRIWNKIPNKEAYSMIFNQRGKPFIAYFLNGHIDNFLKSVQKAVETLMDAGESEQMALLRSLSHHRFGENPELYLKLAGLDSSPEYVELMKSAVAEMRKSAEKTKEPEDISAHLAEKDEEILSLKGEMEQLRVHLEAERDENQQALTKQRDELEDKARALEDTRQELDRLRALIACADFSETEQDKNLWPYVSLCEVEGPNLYGSGLIMRRLADIDIESGAIQDEFQPEYPSLRSLYDNYRTDKDSGFIGVWGWNLEENWNTGQKNFVRSEFYECPVEIAVLSGCPTADDIAQRLLDGVPFKPSGNKILFSCTAAFRNYTFWHYIGLLCEENDITVSNGTVKLKPGVFSLPLYEFSEREILRISKRLFFYKLYAGVPKEQFRVRDPLEVVRHTVLYRWNKKLLQSYQFSNPDRQKFLDFIKRFPVSDLYQDIAQTCSCPNTEAREYVDEFVQKAELYLRREDLDGKTLSAAIASNHDLIKQCKAALEEDWRKENSEKIALADRQLAELNEEIETKRMLCQVLEEQRAQYFSEKETFEAEIARRERMAEDVEKGVAARIEAARSNAAAFAADMIREFPFFRPESSAFDKDSETSSQSSAFFAGIDVAPELIEQEEDWQDALSILKDELKEAGIADRFCSGFAAYLYVASLNQTSLLLAGPNGYAIADAFSRAFYGRTAAVLDCSEIFSAETLKICLQCADSVLILRNPLNSGWINHLPELVSVPGKTVFAIQPFAEDLLIEPRGLYHYLLPVLTELIVEKIPSQNLAGGLPGDTFEAYTPLNASSSHRGHASARFSGLIGLAQTRLKSVFTDFHHMTEPKDATPDDYLFGLFPCAYVTGKTDELLKQPNLSLPKDIMDIFHAYLGNAQ